MSVNAPEPGTVKEYLVTEEDTVTVGQDLLKLELGGPAEGGEKQMGGQEPKAPAPDDQSTSSDPKPEKDESKSDDSATKPPAPPKKDPEPNKEGNEPESPPKTELHSAEGQGQPQEPKKSEPKAKGRETAYGSRDERRVWPINTSKAYD